MAKQSSTPKFVSKKHIARLERERRQNRLIVAIAGAGILIVALLMGYGIYTYNLVAEVNGVKIWAGEWQERVKFQRIQLLNTYQQYAFYQQTFGMDVSQQLQNIQFMLNDSNTLGQQVLDQMTDEIIIAQEAE